MGLVGPEVGPWDGTGRRERERDTEGLVAALREVDPEIRRRATLDLRGQAAAIPALLDAHAGERDPAVRHALVTVLSEHDDLDVARAFAAELDAEDVAVRGAAATALESMPRAVASLIQELLDAPQARVRLMAVSLLPGVDHPDTLGWLGGVVARDDDENVVCAAVDAALAAGHSARHLLDEALTRFPANPYLGFLATTLAGVR